MEARGLTKVYRSPEKDPGLWGAVGSLFHRRFRDTRAVDAISFSINEGELVGFLGVNGAGKTTTLKMLSGLLTPTSGEADVLGHVPMHSHKVFGDFLAHYGAVCFDVEDHDALERLGRLFWYTVEFGLIRQGGKVKFYGSGVMSSHGESLAILEGRTEVRDFTLDEVLETPVKVDEIQKVLFAIESFDQIYEAMHEAERRLVPKR